MKKAFSKSATLKYFDNKQPVKLQCDASSTGLGAVLLQCEQPVVYASRAFTKTECNYCQIEKEMLALIFATNQFHQYIYGLPVELETDHKPLETIFRKP